MWPILGSHSLPILSLILAIHSFSNISPILAIHWFFPILGQYWGANCPANLSSEFVRRNCPANLFGKIVWRICPAKLSGKFVWRNYPAKLSGEFVWRICSAKLSNLKQFRQIISLSCKQRITRNVARHRSNYLPISLLMGFYYGHLV